MGGFYLILKLPVHANKKSAKTKMGAVLFAALNKVTICSKFCVHPL